MSPDSITVDSTISKDIGSLMHPLGIISHYKAPNSALDMEFERFYWFVHVVICHQINAEFLDEAFRTIPKDEFTVEKMMSISEEEVFGLLKTYRKPDKIQAKERASMIRESCKILKEKYGGMMINLLLAGDFSVEGVKKELDNFPMFFGDPLRKKSNVLVFLFSRLGIAELKHINKIDPIIDYHLIRMALRNGRIQLHDESLKKKILEKIPVTAAEDEFIRRKVSEAFRYTLESSKRDIPAINWIEWHLARSFCVRGEPKCKTSENPLKDVLEFEFHHECPLFEHCERNKEYTSEPVFKTNFY